MEKQTLVHPDHEILLKIKKKEQFNTPKTAWTELKDITQKS